MKKLLIVLSACFAICCTSPVEKGRALLYSVPYSHILYYDAHCNDSKDPVALAKRLASREDDDSVIAWYRESGKVPIDEALENHWVRYGMKYDDIVTVLGTSRYVDMSYGTVYRARYAIGDHSYFLYFDSYGRLERINEQTY